MHLKKRQTCRVCGSKSLTQVVSLGYQYLQGSFVNPNKEIPSTRKIECALVRCNPELDEDACGLLQMKYSVPTEILYNVYWYRTGTNNTMRTHLKEMVDEILDIIKIDNGSVLDIGCNDGTQLSYYPELFEKFGVDPSDIATEITGAYTVYSIGFFMISSDDKKTKYVGMNYYFFPVENSIFKFSDLDIEYINEHINESETIKNYIKKLTEPMPIMDKLDDEERDIFKGVF